MHIDTVLAVLDSYMRREIIKVISKKPSTTLQVFKELNSIGLKVRYRETVYRALEMIVAAGLAEKYYDKDKGLCYKTIINRITLDLTQGTITDEQLKAI